MPGPEILTQITEGNPLLLGLLEGTGTFEKSNMAFISNLFVSYWATEASIMFRKHNLLVTKMEPVT